MVALLLASHPSSSICTGCLVSSIKCSGIRQVQHNILGQITVISYPYYYLGDYTLDIEPVLLEDDAVFQCQVGAADGVDPIRSRYVKYSDF